MKRLNIRLLVWLIVTPVVFAVCVHFLHAFQIDRNAGSLRSQAEDAVKKGKRDEAIKLYSQYLKHRSQDSEAYNKFALLTADQADEPTATSAQIRYAMGAMEEAVRRHEKLADVRNRLVTYYMRYGRLRDAMDHIVALKASGAAAKDIGLDVKHAQCLLATGQEEQAVKLLSELIGFDTAKQEFQKAPARGSHEVDAHVLLAEIYRKRAENSGEAELVIEQLVKMNPKAAKAWLAHGRFRQAQKKLDVATSDLKTARELAPNDADILIASAEIAGAQKDFEQANELLNEGVKQFPKDERMYRALSSLALQRKQPAEAMKYVEQGLAAIPSSQYLLLFRSDLELQAGDLEGARVTLQKMREAKSILPELIDLIENRILVAEEKWTDASKRLERLRPLMARFPDFTQQIDMLLGQCYQSQGQPDRAIDAFTRVLDVDSNSVAARLGLAQAKNAIGKGREAEEEMKRVGEMLSRTEGQAIPPGVLNSLLQREIATQLRKPEADRNWKQVDAFVAEIDKSEVLDESKRAVLKAEIAIFKGKLQEARAELNDAVKKNPKDLTVWIGSINLAQRKLSDDETPEDVEKRVLAIIARADKVLGPTLPIMQAQLGMAGRLEGKEAKAGVAQVEARLKQLPEKEQAALLADLGNAWYRQRDYENARRCWLQVAEVRPDDARIQQTLFELAVEFGADKDMDASLDAIRKSRGTDSSLYQFCDAERSLWRFKQKKAGAEALQAAKKQLDEARKQRPDWHEIARLSGEIYEVEGKLDDAITNYQRALELGPANPNIARRLVAMLYQSGRPDEVEEAMTHVGRLSDSDPLKRIEIAKDMQAGKIDEALADAAKVVAADPNNAANLLWYAQLLSRAERGDEAEKAFRTAIEKDPKSPQAWLSLVSHLARGKKIIDAQAVIRDATTKLPEESLDLFSGQSAELVNDLKAAAASYQTLLKKKPNDLPLMRNLAAFYLRTEQMVEADKQLEKMMSLPAAADPKAPEADRGHVQWARRAKAQTMAVKGDFRGSQDAIQLLDANKVDGKLPAEDMMLAASILAKRQELSSKVQALKLLEQVQAVRTMSPDEMFVMAQLYDQTGDWAKGRDTLINMLTKVQSNPQLAQMFAQMLLRHDELVEAERWVNKVEEAAPDSAAAMELRARLLAKQGKKDEATLLLTKLVESAPNEQAKLSYTAAAASMLEEFGQIQAAEELLRQAVSTFPRAKIALGSFMGRNGDIDEAFALLEDARKSYPLADVIQAGLETLRRRTLEADKKYFKTVNGWIQTTLQDDPEALKSNLQLAELRDIEGQSAEVISIYRRILANKKLEIRERAIVDNNLAFVLALSGKSSEAAESLKLINESIDVLGPSSDLLDTRAVCHLALGDTKSALTDLQAAIVESPSAVKYMHLAMTQVKAGDAAAAKKSLGKARELKLDLNALSAQERENYNRLAKQLEK